MNAATVTLWTAAVLIFAYAPVYLLVVGIRERRRDREDARRRTEQDRDVTPEWLALLAAVEPERPALPQRRPTSDCPIFSELASERLAAELNDDAAVAAWLDGAK